MDWPHIQTGPELDERDAVNRALAQRDFEDLRREVAELRASVDGLVNAWNTTTSVISFVKWVAATAAALTALWVLFKARF